MARLMLALFYTAWADLHIFSSGYAKTSSVDHVDCPRFLCLMANTSFNPLNFCYEGMDSFFDDGICLDFCRDLLFKGR